MRRIMVAIVMAATALAGAASRALASDDVRAWYINPMLQYDKLDDRRNADQGYAYQLGLGYDFAPEWAAEFDYSTWARCTGVIGALACI